MPNAEPYLLPYLDRLERVTDRLHPERQFLTWVEGDPFSTPTVVYVYGGGRSTDPRGVETNYDYYDGPLVPGTRRVWVEVGDGSGPAPMRDGETEYLVLVDSNRSLPEYRNTHAGDVVVFPPASEIGYGVYSSNHRSVTRVSPPDVDPYGEPQENSRWAYRWARLMPATPALKQKVRVLTMPEGTDPGLAAAMIGRKVTVRGVSQRGIKVTLPRPVAREFGLTSSTIWARTVDLHPDRCGRCSNTVCRCIDCAVCGVPESPSHVISVHGLFAHTNCAVSCTACRRWEIPTRITEVTGSRYCRNCVTACRGCGGSMPTQRGVDYCINCGGGEPVRGYGHTRPEVWLGGPLPIDEKTGHQDGFYIGFELEITSSDRSRTKDLRDWAEEHLGVRGALDLKSDSSVQGFEIASQPMTPEFFESVPWESFFTAMERRHPANLDRSPSREPDSHGLHVHIGRIAFDRDDTAMAMFCHLLGQDGGVHLERVGRRDATQYCRKVAKPLSAALVDQQNKGQKYGVQRSRLSIAVRPGRDSINLTNQDTVEVRAFRSTRDADHLRAAVRMVYLAARYIRHLRTALGRGMISPSALHWNEFVKWVAFVMPEAVEGLTVEVPKTAADAANIAIHRPRSINDILSGMPTVMAQWTTTPSNAANPF